MGISSELSGQRIAELLSRKGMMQKDLAHQLGITTNTVSYWVHGRRQPTLEQYAGIAEIFSVSTDYLLGLSDIPVMCPSLADELGLSYQAVDRLKEISRNPKQKKVFQKLFESEALYCLIDMLGRE